jgi:hypothetical protein
MPDDAFAGRFPAVDGAVEVFEDVPAGTNSGRELSDAALGHVGAGEAVWAQVSPGNAASLQMFLAVGFRPVGAEMPLARAGRTRWSGLTDPCGDVRSHACRSRPSWDLKPRSIVRHSCSRR